MAGVLMMRKSNRFMKRSLGFLLSKGIVITIAEDKMEYIGVNTLSGHEINCLGQALETTWGRSSQSKGAHTHSTTGILEGDVLIIKCVTVITIMQDQDTRSQVKKYDNELKQMCQQYLKDVKKEFKELSGRALKTKQNNEDDSIEIVSMCPYSAKRTAYYRKNFYLTIS
jgi:hypothetical protein